jgi:hypothetical protein
LKESAPGSIMEGQDAVYNIRLNGPPPSAVALGATDSDDLTR